MHGWREFVGEVGIIVLGVLIALGAEQLVETLHWRYKVAEFRTAEDLELSLNLAAFRYRLIQSPCVDQRIAELQQWGNQSKAGQLKPLMHEIGRPSTVIQRTSVWSASNDALEHMSLGSRVEYSRLHDLLESAQQQILSEREAWRSLAAFNGADALTPTDRMHLNELLYRAKSIDWVLRNNGRAIGDAAARLGVRPDFGSEGRFIAQPDHQFCEPLLAARRAP